MTVGLLTAGRAWSDSRVSAASLLSPVVAAVITVVAVIVVDATIAAGASGAAVMLFELLVQIS